MAIQTFRDLVVWQRGMELARRVYAESQVMPRDEIFGLTSQMRRAANSIPLNIAEGYGKHSRPELVRGLRIATGSLMELMTAWELAVSLKMVPECQELLDLMREEDRLLSSMIRKLEAKPEANRRTTQ